MSNLMCNQGVLLFAKYERGRARDSPGDLDVLNEAIQSGQIALELAGRHESTIPDACGSLGIWLGTKFKASGALADAQEAIKYATQGLSATPQNHPRRARYLSDLAATLERQFIRLIELGKKGDAMACLEEALLHGRESVDKTDQRHPSRSERLSNLATLFAHKHFYCDDAKVSANALGMAKELIRLAAKCPAAPPIVRITAAHKAGRSLLIDKKWQEADAILQEAIGLLPRIAGATITTEDQRHVLRELSGLGTASAEAGLRAGCQPWEALRRLEAARCVIAETGMKHRGDLADLMHKDAALATRYKALRDGISQGFRGLTLDGEYLQSRRLQEARLQELDDVEERVRQIPGLERFQLPMTEDEVKLLAEEGPIITFNIGLTRSDIIVATSSDIRVIPLPIQDRIQVEARMKSFSVLGQSSSRHGVVREQQPPAHSLEDNLQWLWDFAVEHALDNINVPASRRVWWITSGLLGSAPLHLAGDQAPGATENTMSRCISSYVSSFKALRYARERARAVQVDRKVLLVTMPTNPYPYIDLLTEPEEVVLTELFEDQVTHLQHPSPSDVLEQSPGHQLVHFACHGLSVNHDPARSGLLLVHDGDPAMLTVSELEKSDFEFGYLAYLSACSTAEIGDGALQDEAIHLANSFQLIGFPHVVGSIWPADDTAAGEIARGFYTRLLNEDGLVMENKVSRALHDSMLEYRSKCPATEVAKWGPFIHVGV
jgi:tetratricopeptide (TPR) repeat protein